MIAISIPTVTGTEVRVAERRSIREFMESQRDRLVGRVLDFGAGSQPYRDLVSGEYVPYEKGFSLPGGYFDAVMCNQVIEYLEDPRTALVWAIRAALRPGGVLIMTYPTCWDEVETSDYWRYTKAGMERLLSECAFRVLHHERRAEIDLGGFKLPLGYGLVACKA